jgi:transposase
LCSEFAALKDEVCPWRSEVVVGSMQAGLEQLGRALQNHSKGKIAGRRFGFPRFRAKGRCHESVIFQRPRLVDSRHVMLDRRLGPLRTKESMRKLLRLLARDERARVLRSTVQRTNGGWVISFTVERSPKARRARRPDAVVGVETLAVKNMMANRRLARHVSDVGWGAILAQLAYKTSWSDGSLLVAADRFYPSSKTCSACGAVRAKLSLAERVFSCDEPACGHVQDRDLNAALNLAHMAHRHAQAEGLQCYVAATEAETQNARGGQVGLDPVEHSPVKREGPSGSSQRGDALALAG